MQGDPRNECVNIERGKVQQSKESLCHDTVVYWLPHTQKRIGTVTFMTLHYTARLPDKMATATTVDRHCHLLVYIEMTKMFYSWHNENHAPALFAPLAGS